MFNDMRNDMESHYGLSQTAYATASSHRKETAANMFDFGDDAMDFSTAQISASEFQMSYGQEENDYDSSKEDNFDQSSNNQYDQEFFNKKVSYEIYRVPIIYLKWMLDYESHDSKSSFIIAKDTEYNAAHEEVKVNTFMHNKSKYKLKKPYVYPFFGSRKSAFESQMPKLSESNLKKIKAAGLFDMSNYEIYNLYRFLDNFLKRTSQPETDLKYEDFYYLIHEQKNELEQKSQGCNE